jgi:cyclophilin family peptidyl-prolyl cis-trans isomerase
MTLLFLVLSLLVASGSGAAAENPVAVIETNFGDITVELFPEIAPETVENFLQYARDGFYEGTVFHRVERNVLIQGGGFTPGLQRKKTREPIRNEARNVLKNDRGTLAMARGGGIHSATSQFFINLKNNPSFNHKGMSRDKYGYAVFGKVIEGFDVASTIGALKTTKRNGMRDVPTVPVVIKKVRIVGP